MAAETPAAPGDFRIAQGGETVQVGCPLFRKEKVEGLREVTLPPGTFAFLIQHNDGERDQDGKIPDGHSWWVAGHRLYRTADEAKCAVMTWWMFVVPSSTRASMVLSPRGLTAAFLVGAAAS